MKPYQLSGLSFLIYLYENGISGLLGDEMGLGKTLQTLSLFQYLEEQKQSSDAEDEHRPYLVVCPLSVLNSWVSEARKWTPGLRVLRFHGPSSERNHLKKVALGTHDRYGHETARVGHGIRRGRATGKASKGVDHKEPSEAPNLVITTYETFVAEKAWFQKSLAWRYVVLDEGHKIKNHHTNVSSALQSLRAEHRLILTG